MIHRPTENQHFCRKVLTRDRRDHFIAFHLRGGDVHQEHGRLILLDRSDGLGPVNGLTDYFNGIVVS